MKQGILCHCVLLWQCYLWHISAWLILCQGHLKSQAADLLEQQTLPDALMSSERELHQSATWLTRTLVSALYKVPAQLWEWERGTAHYHPKCSLGSQVHTWVSFDAVRGIAEMRSLKTAPEEIRNWHSLEWYPGRLSTASITHTLELCLLSGYMTFSKFFVVFSADRQGVPEATVLWWEILPSIYSLQQAVYPLCS